jgi:hypothetical protein
MRARFAILTVLAVFSALIASPAHLHGLQAAQAAPHDEHHSDATETPGHAMTPEAQANMMATMMASDAKLDALVTRMNDAKGAAKTDAIAELLTAIVQEHHTMCGSMMTNMSMMNNMMSMMNMMNMNMMGGMGGRGDMGSMPPKK